MSTLLPIEEHMKGPTTIEPSDGFSLSKEFCSSVTAKTEVPECLLQQNILGRLCVYMARVEYF